MKTDPTATKIYIKAGGMRKETSLTELRRIKLLEVSRCCVSTSVKVFCVVVTLTNTSGISDYLNFHDHSFSV